MIINKRERHIEILLRLPEERCIEIISGETSTLTIPQLHVQAMRGRDVLLSDGVGCVGGFLIGTGERRGNEDKVDMQLLGIWEFSDERSACILQQSLDAIEKVPYRPSHSWRFFAYEYAWRYLIEREKDVLSTYSDEDIYLVAEKSGGGR